MSSSAAFPFDLLHAEAVRYAKEAERRRCAAKTQWGEIRDSCVDPETMEKHNQLINEAFSHANAETQLESMGFRIGQVLAEKVSKDSTRFSQELEVVKFICKEFWSAVFGKQVDNLRTNHQGVYVVQDNKMTILMAFSEGAQYQREAGLFLALPTGIIRGALHALGIHAIVTPTLEALPSVKFHIQVQSRL